MSRAYVGLGANLGPREVTLLRAVDLLAGEPGIEVLAVSQLRETEPVGVTDQPEFLNGAVAVETSLSPRALLDALLRVEQALGRVRDDERWGPRTIDLDLLVYGDEIVDRAGAARAASAASRAPFRARAARRPGSRADDPRCREGCRAPREARLSSMSHLDELDEFEAELEISLKREYSAVFGLFRYCVLTQDATYLCNQLDVESLPQASYPFFHVRMEDVWVWDKNRPTRIIPRAEVYTSGDVTIEELRGEGEEPRLSAEALAERIGQQLPGDDEPS